jgi:energy-converting hydrogenase Eha subunit A
VDSVKSISKSYLRPALIVAVGGLAMFVALIALISGVHQLVILGLEALSVSDPDENGWIRVIAFSTLLILFGVLTWSVLRSDRSDLLKATFSVVPYALAYTVIAGNLGAGLMPALGVGVAFFIVVAVYLSRRALPWIYSYALGFTSLAMLVLVLSDQ